MQILLKVIHLLFIIVVAWSGAVVQLNIKVDHIFEGDSFGAPQLWGYCSLQRKMKM